MGSRPLASKGAVKLMGWVKVDRDGAGGGKHSCKQSLEDLSETLSRVAERGLTLDERAPA